MKPTLKKCKNVVVYLTASLALSLGASAKANIFQNEPAQDTASETSHRHFLDEVPRLLIPSDITPDELWMQINIHDRKLIIYRGHHVIKSINHVAIGENGADWIRKQGSKITPVGEFRIERINPYSQFHRFYGIDYPNPSTARLALDRGMIDYQEYTYITNYHNRHGRAPANTRLGGNIGIHGIGSRDARLHRLVDWTLGCIATDNTEIDLLTPWLANGMRIRIDV